MYIKQALQSRLFDGEGRSVVEGVVRTRADAIRDFIKGLSGTVHVTLEEGTQAAWLYEIIRPLVAEVIVCDPRQNKVLAVGNKGDRIDANKLAQLLRSGLLKPVYHNNRDTKPLKQLAHNYGSILGDCTRVMNCTEDRGFLVLVETCTTSGTGISGWQN